MKMLLRCLVSLGALAILTLPAFAEEQGEDLGKDAQYAEGTPPMVPHRIDNKTSESCLTCHRTGLNGAPVSPHPIRLDCTQCHGQGEITDKKDSAKQRTKSKRKSREAVKE